MIDGPGFGTPVPCLQLAREEDGPPMVVQPTCLLQWPIYLLFHGPCGTHGAHGPFGPKGPLGPHGALGPHEPLPEQLYWPLEHLVNQVRKSQ